MTSALPRTLSMICLACLAHSARAEEHIRDDAKLFHAAAIEQAEQKIAEIHRTFHRRVFVRTVVSVAPGQGRWLPFLRTPQVNRMLEEQAAKYADEVGIPGIYVVICTRPRDVHVIVRPEDDPEFTHRDAEALRRMLARSLHDKGADPALDDVVKQVQTVLQDHVTRGSSLTRSNDVAFAGLLGGGVGLWLLLRMIRFKMQPRQAATSWQEGSVRDPKTPARETAAVLGSLFGFPGGLWIYDKLYPCPPGVTPQCQPHEEPAVPVAEENSAKPEGDPQTLPEHAEDASVLP